MGFPRLSISKKYIGYAFSASLAGGILGLALGCTLIPLVIANAFNIMYAIPVLEFKMDSCSPKPVTIRAVQPPMPITVIQNRR